MQPERPTTVASISTSPANQLAKVVEQGALFRLTLALVESGFAAVRVTESRDAVVDDDFPARLNQYRQPPLDASGVSANFYLTRREQLAGITANRESIRLWQCMHPDPLSLYNDTARLDDSVVANCAYVTQMRLQGDNDTSVEADPTLLSDIIPDSQSFLSA